MMKIIQGQSNTVTLTLTENVTLTSPYYLFEFIKNSTGQKFYCIPTDTSSYTYRYNRFTITEGSTVTLAETGEYTYNVYEQLSSTNTNPSNAYALLETGMAKVFAATTYTKTFTGTNTGKTFTL